MSTKKTTEKISAGTAFADEQRAPRVREADVLEPEVVGVEAGEAAQAQQQDDEDDRGARSASRAGRTDVDGPRPAERASRRC